MLKSTGLQLGSAQVAVCDRFSVEFADIIDESTSKASVGLHDLGYRLDLDKCYRPISLTGIKIKANLIEGSGLVI